VPFKTSGNTISLDSSGLTNGSSIGKDMYNKVWDSLDQVKMLQKVDNLTEVNIMRYPINAYERLLARGSVPIEGGKSKLTELANSAIKILNRELSARKLPNIDRLSSEQIKELGPILGADKNFRTNVNSLELYKRAAQILKHQRTLSVIALAPLINAAYEEDE
jgi:hypothetical protein